MGGTFDILHVGHLKLLKTSFDVSKFVVIGVTSDEFVRLSGKIIQNSFNIRVKNLMTFIQNEIQLESYEITKLENEFGPLMISDKIECLVVSRETEGKGEKINQIRSKLGLQPISILVVDLILAEDGDPVSSRRIRSNIIDKDGNLIKKE